MSLSDGGHEPQRGNDHSQTHEQRKISYPAAVLLKVGNYFQRQREKAKDPEYRKERRERWTIVGLFLAAGLALLQWRELRSTDHNIAEQARIGAGQLRAMRDQLAEMKSTGAQNDNLIDTNKRLAEAAARSADTAERALKVAQRAYFAVLPRLSGFERNGNPKISIVARNVGATPAYNVRMKTHIGVIFFPFQDALTLPEDVTDQVSVSTISKEETIAGIVTLTHKVESDHFDKIEKDAGMKLLGWALLEFEDAFGCKIRRRLCFMYGGESARTGNDPQLCTGQRNDESYTGKCTAH